MFKSLYYFVTVLHYFVKSDNQAYVNDTLYVNCKENSCLLVKSFQIPDNNSLSCVEDTLKILFEYQLENKTKMQVEGYILEGDTNILTNKQRISKFCRKIRRYW